MESRIPGILGASFVLTLALAVDSAPASEHAVRIAGTNYLGDLPTHVAQARELFAEHDLEAIVEFNASGKNNLARLREGEVHFALMALTPLVLDRLADPDPGQADDPVILASLLQSHELTSIIASTEISKPTDLAGRRIAFEEGTNTEFVWWLFEQFHGIDRATVQAVSVPFEKSADALLSGSVDAAVLPEPWASQIDARSDRLGKSAPRRFDTRGLYAGRWVLVTTRERVQDQRAICSSVLAAYRKAIDLIERAPSESIAIYTRNAEEGVPTPPERWELLDYDLSLDWALIASLQEQFLWAREIGIAAEAASVQVLELLEPGPLNDSWPQAVQLPVVERSRRQQ